MDHYLCDVNQRFCDWIHNNQLTSCMSHCHILATAATCGFPNNTGM